MLPPDARGRVDAACREICCVSSQYRSGAAGLTKRSTSPAGGDGNYSPCRESPSGSQARLAQRSVCAGLGKLFDIVESDRPGNGVYNRAGRNEFTQ